MIQHLTFVRANQSAQREVEFSVDDRVSKDSAHIKSRRMKYKMRNLVIAILLPCGVMLANETRHEQEHRAIAGGQSATAAQFPFMVEVDGIRDCIGVLIAETWILTAAQCIDGADYIAIRHISGEVWEGSSLSNWRNILHPEYDPLSGEDTTTDLALIQMDQPFKSRYARSIGLPTAEESLRVQTGLMVTSVGREHILGVLPRSGYYTSIAWPLVSCHSPKPWILCVQSTDLVHAQVGDSGSAMITREGEDWILIGIGFYLDGANQQYRVQNITYHQPWIQRTLGPSGQDFIGATVSINNETGKSCKIQDLLNPSESAMTSSGSQDQIQITGEKFRTILMLECGNP